MNIIRKYKIHLLFNCLVDKDLKDLNFIFELLKFRKENYELIDFIYNNYLNLVKVELKEYPNKLFYFKNNKIIFIKDLNSEVILYRNDLIYDNIYFYKILENCYNKNYYLLNVISEWYEIEIEKNYLIYKNELNKKS